MQGWSRWGVLLLVVVAPGGFLLLPLLLREPQAWRRVVKLPQWLTKRS